MIRKQEGMVQRLGEMRKGRRERIEKGSREGIEKETKRQFEEKEGLSAPFIRISIFEENKILEVKAEDWEREQREEKGDKTEPS